MMIVKTKHVGAF